MISEARRIAVASAAAADFPPLNLAASCKALTKSHPGPQSACALVCPVGIAE
jgi:hypothetical protein